MAQDNRAFLTAVGATPASDTTYFQAGPRGATVSVANNIGVGEEVEIMELRGTSYESVKDPDDTTDVTKKVLNANRTSRSVSPGFRGAIRTSGAATVYITQEWSR